MSNDKAAKRAQKKKCFIYCELGLEIKFNVAKNVENVTIAIKQNDVLTATAIFCCCKN